MILFATIHQRVDQYLFQSLREVIKLWFPSQQGIKNITQFILVLETWTIRCDAHILWVWSQLRFFLFRKVSLLLPKSSELTMCRSKQKTSEACSISDVLSSTLSHMFNTYFLIIKTINDYPRGRTLPRWTFSTRHFLSWSVYCGLSGASMVSRDRPILVCCVRPNFYLV